MYQEQRILKRIDKPLLYLTKRIRKNALALEQGQRIYASVSDETKKRLIDLDKKLKKKNIMGYAVAGFIVIAFSLAILAAFVCVTAVPERNIWYEIPALIFMEGLLWVPTILFIYHQMKFSIAVKKGEIQLYQFRVQGKWIYEYGINEEDDDGAVMLLIQFGNAYTEVWHSYKELEYGDIINVYIISYKGRQYFAMLGL